MSIQNDEIYIDPMSCTGCGKCLVGCKQRAITVNGNIDEKIMSTIKGVLSKKQEGQRMILVFLDNIGYTAADNIGVNRLSYPESIHIIKVISVNRVRPKHIHYALDNGADGVFIGEFPGDLMYDEVERKIQGVKDRIEELGGDSQRLTFSKVYIPYFSGLARKFQDFDAKIAELEGTIASVAEALKSAPKEVVIKANNQTEEIKALKAELSAMNSKMARLDAAEFINEAVKLGDVKFVAKVVKNSDGNGLRAICDEKEILLIFDEVQTGMGRCGEYFAHQLYGVEPDIFTSAKALGGGVPIGAVCAKADVASAFEPGDHGTTFGGNPLATAAGLAVLDIIEKEKLVENSDKMGKLFREKLNGLKAKYPDKIVDVRGEGLLIGVEVQPDIAKAVFTGLHNCKMLTSLCKGLTVRVAPPLNITEKEIDLFINAFDATLKEDI